MRDAFIAFIVIALVAVASFAAGRLTAKKGAETVIVERVDTLSVRDTICVVEPRYISRRVVDSVLVPVTDSVILNDTVFVALAREQVTWEDTLARVYASGINPLVDSVIHFTERTVITKTFPVRVPYRWGVGVQVGAGVGKGGVTPYVGIGLSYNILSF